ncbi:MAG: transposase [Mycobacterium sp.]|nr:tyrosine-type recombinase/integrase [Mycobacterium sp.]TXI37406.1 MAG: transposase [Mycobacterium sp.]
MATVQRVRFGDGRRDTYTVVGEDALPIPQAREYLRFLSDGGASPHTVRGYAYGLAEWWTLLTAVGAPWDDFPTSLFGQFLTYLRTGDLPADARIGPAEQKLATSSVQQRAAAVLSMYRYHADAHHVDAPYDRLFTSRGRWRRQHRYVGFLDGVGPQQHGDHPIYRTRTPNRSTTPVLLPGQVNTILDACATQDDNGAWLGSPSGLRNRLLFAALAETGMRLGEALSLRHNDIRIGGGETPSIEVVERQDHPHGVRVKTGSRRIYVGDDLAALYSEYVWQLVDLAADVTVADLPTHFVFVNITHGPRFAPMRPETVYEKVRSIKRAHPGTVPPDWTPHWLRHTHATALLLAGVAPHVVMRRLGHADVQTTLSTYGWVTQEAEMRSLAEWKNFTAGWKGLTDAQQ